MKKRERPRVGIPTILESNTIKKLRKKNYRLMEEAKREERWAAFFNRLFGK